MDKYLLYIAWMIAVVATVGSLFFSEILHFPPCVLCWYQRVFMYPLVVLMPLGILKKDSSLPDYVLTLTLIGLGIALYHLLLQQGIIPTQLAPCEFGVSCTTKFDLGIFNFLTIPLLSFMAFLMISLLMFRVKSGEQI